LSQGGIRVIPHALQPGLSSAPGIVGCRHFLSVTLSQFLLRLRQDFFPPCWELLSGAVDIKGEHRHRRSIWCALAAATFFGRALERSGDAARVFPRKDSPVQLERVAMLRNRPRPSRGFSTARARTF